MILSLRFGFKDFPDIPGSSVVIRRPRSVIPGCDPESSKIKKAVPEGQPSALCLAVRCQEPEAVRAGFERHRTVGCGNENRFTFPEGCFVLFRSEGTRTGQADGNQEGRFAGQAGE